MANFKTPETPEKLRVSCFIDGFNLYHAIDDLQQPHLKWLNLRSLMEVFHDPHTQGIGDIFYFSAIAEWRKSAAAKHKMYIRALKEYGVQFVPGNFKEKPGECKSCNAQWIGHEEKQTDVNIATWLIREAFHNNYDIAFVVTGDSDLLPPLRMISEFPKRRAIKIIVPPGRRHAKELVRAATKKAAIKVAHLEKCLLPQQILNAKGNVVADRPAKYDPPA